MKQNVTASSSNLETILVDWLFYTITRDEKQSLRIKKIVDGVYQSHESSDPLLIISLAAYNEWQTDYTAAKDLLAPIKGHLLDGYLAFYYYFLQAKLKVAISSDYEGAVNDYKYAENYLDNLSHPIIEAEFSYNIGCAYYYQLRTYESLSYLTNAMNLFKKNGGSQYRLFSCDIVNGLNCIDMKQYENAEVNLLNVLDYAVHSSDKSLKTILYHNLGLLYSEQNLPLVSIRYLNEILDKTDYNNHISVVYLACREYAKLENHKRAWELHSYGLSLAEQMVKDTFNHLFDLVRVRYLEPNTDDLESVFIKAINYFQETNQLMYLKEFSKLFGEYYYKTDNFREASIYYRLHTQASEKL